MLTINTNVNALKLQNNLSRTTFALDNAFVRLSTGAKINSAADGAAQLMLSKGLETQISGLSVCNNNAQMAKNLLGVADGVLNEVTSMAQRLRDISLMAANGVYSLVERVAFQKEADALVAEIKRQVSEARFNDYKLFKDGGAGASPAVASEPEPMPMMFAMRSAPAMASEPAAASEPTAAGPVMTQTEAEAAGYTWVTTVEGLQTALANNENIALGGNIDLFDIADWSNETTYTGTFEGNNYTISNLTSTTQGLFTTIYGGTVQNLNLSNFNVSGNNTDIGCLANKISGEGTIYNTHVLSGNVEGNNKNYQYTGGLVGYQYSGIISNSSSVAKVLGTYNTGGLAGCSQGTITECFSTGKVVSNTTGDKTGGLVGYQNGGAITKSYATGFVSARTNTGGLVGYNAGTIENCFATGDVAYSSLTTRQALVGDNTSGTITNCYYNSECGAADTNAIGKEESWFTSVNVYSAMGITLAEESKSSESGGILTQSEAVALGYSWVTDAEELQTALNGGRNIALGANIDLTGVDWTNIENFSLVFEGNNYTISNLTDDQGLFTNISGGTVQNLNLENFTITNTSEKTGGLTGSFRYGKIDNVHITNSSITGTSYVGGLIGYLYSNDYNYKLETSIINSSSTASVSGSSCGGLIGYTELDDGIIEIENCWTSGIISGSSPVGGLVGYIENANAKLNIKNCYTTGEITGTQYIGGIVGKISNWHDTINIINCNSSGTISSKYEGGGIIGYYGGSSNAGGTLNLTNINFSGNIQGVNSSTGGIAGYIYSGGDISNAEVNISSLEMTGTVTGGSSTGGLIGSCNNYGNSIINISDSYSTGTVSGTSSVGGAIGKITNKSTVNINISNTYTTGEVTGTSSYIGGLVGQATNSSTSAINISNSYATGDVSSTYRDSYVGGFAGKISNTSTGTIEISDSYSAGNVTGKNYTSGFVSSNTGSVTNCYSTGTVTSTGTNVGGFSDSNTGTIANSYYNTSTGAIDSSGATGKDETWFTEENLLAVGITNTGGALNIEEPDPTPDPTPDPDPTPEPDPTPDPEPEPTPDPDPDEPDTPVVPPTPRPSGGTGSITFQIGTGAGGPNTISVDMDFEVGELSVNLMDADSARNALVEIDNLIQKVTKMQGGMGASSNIIDSVIDNNTQTRINLAASNSRLIDADIARESAEMVKNQIRQNMTASLLTQATNNLGPIALTLMGIR